MKELNFTKQQLRKRSSRRKAAQRAPNCLDTQYTAADAGFERISCVNSRTRMRDTTIGSLMCGAEVHDVERVLIAW